MSELVDIVREDFIEARDFVAKRKSVQVEQLKLFNNLQRGDELIASDLLHTFFNRAVSDLYDDKMQVKFVAGEDSDRRKTETLGTVAISDYQEMGKRVLDYDWLWDTLFYGEGYADTIRWDKRRLM